MVCIFCSNQLVFTNRNFTGASEVKEHPFFNGVNWNSLLTRSVPPFVPATVQAEDTSYFEGLIVFVLCFKRIY